MAREKKDGPYTNISDEVRDQIHTDIENGEKISVISLKYRINEPKVKRIISEYLELHCSTCLLELDGYVVPEAFRQRVEEYKQRYFKEEIREAIHVVYTKEELITGIEREKERIENYFALIKLAEMEIRFMQKELDLINTPPDPPY